MDLKHWLALANEPPPGSQGRVIRIAQGMAKNRKNLTVTKPKRGPMKTAPRKSENVYNRGKL